MTGPWAPEYGGYQFPGVTTPAAPQPPPPPSAPTLGQVSQAGGTVGSPSGANLTLGDAQNAGVGEQREPLESRFQKYLALTQAANATAKRNYLDEQSKPGLLANIFTFGMAGLMDQDYRRGYNAAVDKHNATVDLQNTKDALTFLGDDVRQDTGGLGLQMRLMGLDLQKQRLEFDRFYRQQMLGQGRERLNQGQQGLDLRTITTLFNQTVPPPTPEQRAAAGQKGFDWVENPMFPGRGNWVKKGTGGTAEPGKAPDDAAPAAPTPPGSPPSAAPPPGAPPTDSPDDPIVPPPPIPEAPPGFGKGTGPGGVYTQGDLARDHAIEASMKTRAVENEKGLSNESRQTLNGIIATQRLIDQIYSEFPNAKERSEYVGYFQNPAMRAKQIGAGNTRFARFQTLASQIEQAKFQLGGKQLTGIEQQIVERFIPTTREWGGITDFDAKAKSYRENVPKMVNDLLAVQGSQYDVRERMRQRFGGGAATQTPTSTNPPTTPNTLGGTGRPQTANDYLKSLGP